MGKEEVKLETIFLKREDFDSIKGRLKFENPSVLEGYRSNPGDVIAIDFEIHSAPLIKHIEILKGGDFVSFWSDRFVKEGVSPSQLKEAFAVEEIEG